MVLGWIEAAEFRFLSCAVRSQQTLLKNHSSRTMICCQQRLWEPGHLWSQRKGLESGEVQDRCFPLNPFCTLCLALGHLSDLNTNDETDARTQDGSRHTKRWKVSAIAGFDSSEMKAPPLLFGLDKYSSHSSFFGV